ncbi:MAG: hypothetical protein M3458_14865 [Acidobacteriota bacterium]|nr:hypothetical protein [Acidobacteriota bacterium]
MSLPSGRLRKYLRGSTDRDRALSLGQELLVLQGEYPEFRHELEAAAWRVRKQGRRTDVADGDLVVDALAHGCAERREIADETGLPPHELEGLLARMITAGIVRREAKPRPEGRRGPVVWQFFLTGPPAPVPFVTRHTLPK